MKTFTVDGRTFELVEAHRFRSLDEEGARALLREALDDGGGHLLRRLADACGVDPDDKRQVIDRMAREIARGHYLLYTEAPEVALDPRFATEELRWEDLPSLTDLRLDAPDDDERPATATTWLSFEIVDDRGRTADGDFVCTIDGSDHGGELGDAQHRFDELRFGAGARLRARIRFDSSTPLLDPVGPTPDPSVPVEPRADDPVAPKELTFEVVDEAGRPLAGRYTLDDGAGTREGALQGRARVPAESSPRLSLHIDWQSTAPARGG